MIKYPHSVISITAVLLLTIMLGTPSVCRSASAPQFSPYIERFSHGWIDWDNGLIYGIGKGYLNKNNNIKSRAKGAANLIAYSNILKLAAGINLDDKHVLKALGSQQVTINLKAFLKAREHSSEFISKGSQSYFEVVKVAPIKGIEGLAAKLVKNLQSTPWRKLPQPGKSQLDDSDAPWLILDARELGAYNQVEPALFPEIVSAKGETIYSLDKVNENAMANRGMARYVVSSTRFQQLQSGLTPLDSLLAEITELFAISEAEAADRTRRKRGNYIVKKVEGAQGLAKTNLVISETDASSLKKEDASSKILKQCRVIVVVSSPVGGIEGKLRQLSPKGRGAADG